MENCNKPIETIYAADVPTDSLDSLPDYIWAERAVTNESTGKTKYTPVRVPATKLFGGGNFDNVTTIEPNATFEVVDGQPIAAYISNEGSYNVVKRADASHDPLFFIIGKMGGYLLIQNTGFINYPDGHEYIVGQQYYLDTATGMPTTNSASGKKLFIPISTYKLAINM